ncbi:DUF4383 domain-containing protein [Actinoalloteichus hymeniacidonis]|uniref:DUF4383 family protein n=1 Tax=Actinoalloteichus hymeniacidonis TaxID=340345 RepID=A0AAC9HQB7_9PSEU|nr:DUF4383 domain-containing protein [Actinoalloteichus hymeniacidonis]AOS63036.1 putative DUF4383 family protein [Actinoalloteichus hymeniacidonis]MBB5908929.1 membrane-bound ClpP family serine protease [Actinoalloteichus hymeniacidonis]
MVQTHGARAADASPSTSAATTAARVVGTIFLLLGVLGFIPGITTNYDTMQFAGHESEAMLFGIFQVSVLHNILHLILGAALLAAGRAAAAAKGMLIGGGVVLLALGLYGALVDQQSTANFFPMNGADNWLHLLTGLGLLLLALLPGSRQDRSSDTIDASRPSESSATDATRSHRPGSGPVYGH